MKEVSFIHLISHAPDHLYRLYAPGPYVSGHRTGPSRHHPGIAATYSISENRLMKVAYHLAHTGIVESIRGKGGGIRLARRPQDIQLGQVIGASEGSIAIVECLAPEGACRFTPCLPAGGNNRRGPRSHVCASRCLHPDGFGAQPTGTSPPARHPALSEASPPVGRRAIPQRKPATSRLNITRLWAQT